MIVLALEQEWSDLYTKWGFFAGALSLLVGVFGFWYTIYQVRKTKSAAIAAEEAAQRMLAENRQRFFSALAVVVARLLADSRRYVAQEDWKIASLITDQLADFLAQLAEFDSTLPNLVSELRKLGQLMAEITAQPDSEFQPRKWTKLVQKLQEKIDRLHAPFSDPEGV